MKSHDELDAIVMSKCDPQAKEFYTSLLHIQPKVDISNTRNTYNINGQEFQLGQAKNFACHSILRGDKSWVTLIESGYSWLFIKRSLAREHNGILISVRMIIKEFNAHLELKLNQSPVMREYMEAIKEQTKDIIWTAKKHLEESIYMYESLKDDKPTQALRALEQIGRNKLVDAFASNKVVVENKIDYAALLEDAGNRALPKAHTRALPEPKVLNDSVLEVTVLEEVDVVE